MQHLLGGQAPKGMNIEVHAATLKGETVRRWLWEGCIQWTSNDGLVCEPVLLIHIVGELGGKDEDVRQDPGVLSVL